MTTESYYPFLAEPEEPAPELLAADLLQCTAEKAREIVRLRLEVAALDGDRLTSCATALAAAFRSGARLFAFGNGGSVTDAEQVARVFAEPPWGLQLPAIALTDPAVVTALANDAGFETVFARQLAALARPGDVALGLSTSGGSGNLLRAFEVAAHRHMITVGLTGAPGGAMAESGQVEHLFIAPSSSVHRIQEIQATTYHTLWELIQRAL